MSLFINYILTILFINSFSFISSSENENVVSINRHKECKIIEECHACTFYELKTIDICQVSGYKKKVYCKEDDKYNNESCKENTRINPVYIFLFICIVIFICSYRYQKAQKNSNLQNLMVKLSILKT